MGSLETAKKWPNLQNGHELLLSFAANKDAADRLKRLGEQQFRIEKVGASQLDEIYNQEIPSNK